MLCSASPEPRSPPLAEELPHSQASPPPRLLASASPPPPRLLPLPLWLRRHEWRPMAAGGRLQEAGAKEGRGVPQTDLQPGWRQMLLPLTLLVLLLLVLPVLLIKFIRVAYETHAKLI